MIRFLVQSLLVFVALASPALAQDGPHTAAAAKEAVVALQSYLDAVGKAGGRPDYTAPPASELLPRIFDLAPLATAAPPSADDVGWLIEWFLAAKEANKMILRFGTTAPADQLPMSDQLAILRNLKDYEDQYATAANFLLRLAARADVAGSVFMEHLPPEQRTPVRLAGQERARHGEAEMLVGYIGSVVQGMKPVNAHLVSRAVRDTSDVWAKSLSTADRSATLKMLDRAQASFKDAETRDNIAAFANALAAAN